jgi:hypothetical protein
VVALELLEAALSRLWDLILDAYVKEKKWLRVALVFILIVLVGAAVSVVLLIWQLESHR